MRSGRLHLTASRCGVSTKTIWNRSVPSLTQPPVRDGVGGAGAGASSRLIAGGPCSVAWDHVGARSVAGYAYAATAPAGGKAVENMRAPLADAGASVDDVLCAEVLPSSASRHKAWWYAVAGLPGRAGVGIQLPPTVCDGFWPGFCCWSGRGQQAGRELCWR